MASSYACAWVRRARTAGLRPGFFPCSWPGSGWRWLGVVMVVLRGVLAGWGSGWQAGTGADLGLAHEDRGVGGCGGADDGARRDRESGERPEPSAVGPV